MQEWWSKLKVALSGRGRASADLREELEAHLEMQAEDNRARGMQKEEARRAARRLFGNTTLILESAQEAWTFSSLENLIKDVAYAIRMARKSPGFAVVAILTLAIGIGGITAMYTVIEAVLLKPFPFHDPDHVVRVLVGGSRRGQPDLGFTLIHYREMQNTHSFAGFGALGIPETVTLSARGGEPAAVREARVSANFLDILGVQPVIGRAFLPEEDRSGGPNVALISYGLWRRRFGGSPKIAGATISLDDASYTVVGVLPRQFEYPWSGYDVWVTRPWEWAEIPRTAWDRVPDLSGVARLRPGVSLEQARSELNVLSRQYALAYPGMPDAIPSARMRVNRLEDDMIGHFRPLLWMLFGAVGFVLLIVCANLAGLLLARSAARFREFSLRAALGASRRRIVQQLLAESIGLSLLGGTAGVLLAKFMVTAMTHLAPINLPQADEIHLDGQILALAAVVSIVVGIVLGLLPSRRISRPNLAAFLREQGASAGRGSPSRHYLGFTFRSALVISQVTLSVVLLVAATLMMKSFVHLHDIDPGFQPAHLLTMKIALPTVRYDSDQKKRAFWDELVQRVGALPGVLGTSVARSLPTTVADLTPFQPADRPRLRLSERPLADLQVVTPGYFRTLGIPLIRGRQFTIHDDDSAAPVAIINEALARRFWPEYPGGQTPISRSILLGRGQVSLNIVGIVADAHEDGLAVETKPELYLPSDQWPPQTAYLAARTVSAPEDLANSVRREVSAIDSGQSVSDVRTMTQLLSASLGVPRLTLVLLTSFAGVAILLAMLGIYGVISFLVVERTQEFGIRQALGAQPKDILHAVLGQGLRLLVTGLAIGIIGALALTRVMKSLLFHVSASDPWAFIGISAFFLAVGLLACYVPARRATRIDPGVALR